MKILFYSANFAPEPTGIGKYSGEMAAWLAARGHEVRVVCAPPYYPAWRVAPGYAWPPWRRESWQGVDVWRAPLWVPQRPGGLARVLHLLSFAVASLPSMAAQIFWRPQVVMTVAPFFVCAPAGWLVARLTGARAWLHVQDFEVDVAFRMGLLKGGLAQRAILGAERWLLRRFDRVSSISRRMRERLVDKGVAPDRVRALPNWVDVDSLRPLDRPSAYRAELGIAADAVVALFSGTLGPKQGLMLIPEAARLLAARPEIVFVVCGDGVMKPALEVACAGLPNVRLLPLQPAARLGELLGLADIHLLTQSPDAEDLVLPSKLSGMLASGRPVVATTRAGTEIAEVLADCGVVVAPEDAAALAAALQDLAQAPERRAAVGRAARLWAERHMGAAGVLAALEADLGQKASP
ncbi:putative glycosyl transferase [Rubrivivax sp. A210]|uniref:glycosyltransferase WbuB n=1 Tax=Rubrivivax sp. A210 TaxID=2772301 RepID=UPI0019189594|nr:glycosyltransferase WbuB [Rubrivivax sp. A210]CAD5369170.1 putative glycosyl transferase [Rubrivivax sp. A210]